MTTDSENPAPSTTPLEIPAEAASPMIAAQPGRPRLAHVPRLGIRHFLAWMTLVSAVMLAFTLLIRAEGDVADSLKALIAVIFSSVAGCVIGGGLLIVWHKVRGTLWPLEPGERLIAGAAWLFVSWTGTLFTIVFIHSMQAGPPGDWVDVVFGTMSFLPTALLYVGMAVAARGTSRWWRGILVLASMSLVSILFTIYGQAADWRWLHTSWLQLQPAWFVFLSIAGLFILAAAVVSDIRRRQPRHWLHWCGVAMLVVCFGGGAVGCTIELLGWWGNW